jgi:hypothetical protein
MAKKNRQELLDYLETLPDTSQEVADLLVKEGITGGHSGENCPVYHLLQNKGFDIRYLGPTTITLNVEGDNDYISLPVSVERFVHLFDEGSFPLLEQKKNSESL